MRFAKDKAVQDEVTQSSDEIKQLKSTIHAQRDELDKVTISYEEKIQKLEYNARDEQAQLHKIISELRTAMESSKKLSKNSIAIEKGQ